MTNAEWAASLSDNDCVAIIKATLKDQDWAGLECALKLLAVKNPALAQEILDTMNLGVKLSSMSPEQRSQAAREAISLGLAIAEERS